MKLRITLVWMGLAALLPSCGFAQSRCPWLNEATASGILGGPVTAKTTIKENGEGVCEYMRKQESAVYQLRISVNLMTDVPKQFPSYLAQCPPKSEVVRAIGNQAVSCSVTDKKDGFVERIVGRVREQAFVIAVSSSLRGESSMNQDVRHEKVGLAAEIVSGNLF